MQGASAVHSSRRRSRRGLAALRHRRHQFSLNRRFRGSKMITAGLACHAYGGEGMMSCLTAGFLRYFSSTSTEQISPDSAGPFHQFRSGWLCYFCYSSRRECSSLGAQPPDLEEARQALGHIIKDGNRYSGVDRGPCMERSCVRSHHSGHRCCSARHLVRLRRVDPARKARASNLVRL